MQHCGGCIFHGLQILHSRQIFLSYGADDTEVIWDSGTRGGLLIKSIIGKQLIINIQIEPLDSNQW